MALSEKRGMHHAPWAARWIIAVLLTLLLLPLGAAAEFSADSSVFDYSLAQYALKLSETCYMPSMQEAVLSIAGYQQIALCNMQREDNDTRHVAAYALYSRKNGNGGTDVIIAVRGTGSGEWKLNMQLMPSGNYDLPYAENFTLAAEDILNTHKDFFDSLTDAAILITGHSRGAAVANILGAWLTDRYGAENVFVYTFATPCTVRGEYPDYSNIFNVINPADIVTYLPLPQWGFSRYGTDILLPVSDASLLTAAQAAYAERVDQTGVMDDPESSLAFAQALAQAMGELAPTVAEAYTVRHALTHAGAAGTDEPGMTAAEMMLTIFDGNLLSGQAITGSLGQTLQSGNDFLPMLSVLQATPATAGSYGILAPHMPAIYGAWLTVMETR